MQHLESQANGSQLSINVNSFGGGCHYRDKFDIIVSILDGANGNEVKQVEILGRTKILIAHLKNIYPSYTKTV